MRNVIIILLLMCHWSSAFAEFDSGRSEFSIVVNNEIYPYRLFSTFVLPGELLNLQILDKDDAEFEVIAQSGDLRKVEDKQFTWVAPEVEGLLRIDIKRKSDSAAMRLNVFIMVPALQLVNGQLNGKLIGTYPEPLGNDPLYLPPDGFIRVSAKNLETQVSPHFALGQFVADPKKGLPKYIVLRERLLLKLEVLLERLNERGYGAESLSILAGYITPAKLSASKGSLYSRHIYGGAAAVIIDRDGDSRMDDLNQDGVTDDQDGQLLFNLIDELFQEPDKGYLRGGLLLYRKERSRFGPYVMLDVRGYRKRGWRAIDLPDMMRPKHLRDFIELNKVAKND